MTVAMLAREVGLSENRIRKLANEGVVPCQRDKNNYRLFDERAVVVLKARVAKRHAKQRATLAK